MDHQHIALKAVSGHEFPHQTPCLRDPDNLVYMREEAGRAGDWRLRTQPVWRAGLMARRGSTAALLFRRTTTALSNCWKAPSDASRSSTRPASSHWSAIPGAYTPDCQPMLGPMAGARGMWIAAGMSLNGYGGAGGIGKLMAEWIVEGEPVTRCVCLPRDSLWRLLFESLLRCRADPRGREVLLSPALPQRRE